AGQAVAVRALLSKAVAAQRQAAVTVGALLVQQVAVGRPRAGVQLRVRGPGAALLLAEAVLAGLAVALVAPGGAAGAAGVGRLPGARLAAAEAVGGRVGAVGLLVLAGREGLGPGFVIAVQVEGVAVQAEPPDLLQPAAALALVHLVMRVGAGVAD